MALTDKDLIIWDGDCGFCSRSVQMIRCWDKDGYFSDVSAQQCPTPPMTDEIRRRAEFEVMVWTKDGRLLGGADAAVYVLKHTGRKWQAAILGAPVIIWFTRLAYRLIARHRMFFSKIMFKGETPSCGIQHRPK